MLLFLLQFFIFNKNQTSYKRFINKTGIKSACKIKKEADKMSNIKETNEKIAEKVAEGYKKIEEGVVEGYKKIEEGVVEGYKKIEEGVVEGYKKIEQGAVDGFNKVSDKSKFGGK